MCTEKNRQVIRRFYEQMDEGNLEIIDQLVDANYIGHVVGSEDIRGTDGLKELATIFHSAFPGLQHVIEDIVAEGDKVVGRFTLHAIHKGEFMGITPTNKPVTFTAIGIYRFDNEKLAEDWIEYDALGLLQQLGAVQPLV